MKKTTMIAACLMASVGAMGQSMGSLWKSMPDAMVPYLDARQRQEMVDFVGMGLSGETENLLHGKSRIDTLTADYLHVRLSEAADMEVKRLPRRGGDSLLCVVRTWKAEDRESTVAFYDMNWQPVEGIAFRLPAPPVVQGDAPTDSADALVASLDYVLASCTLAPGASTLVVTWAAPLADKADRERLARALQPVTLRWDGETFVR